MAAARRDRLALAAAAGLALAMTGCATRGGPVVRSGAPLTEDALSCGDLSCPPFEVQVPLTVVRDADELRQARRRFPSCSVPGVPDFASRTLVLLSDSEGGCEPPDYSFSCSADSAGLRLEMSVRTHGQCAKAIHRSFWVLLPAVPRETTVRLVSTYTAAL